MLYLVPGGRVYVFDSDDYPDYAEALVTFPDVEKKFVTAQVMESVFGTKVLHKKDASGFGDGYPEQSVSGWHMGLKEVNGSGLSYGTFHDSSTIDALLRDFPVADIAILKEKKLHAYSVNGRIVGLAKILA